MRSARKRGRDLRSVLLGTAIRLIAEHGFDALALEDVARAAGTSKQGLLYHFESRDALKEGVLEALVSHANQGLIDLMGRLTADPLGRLDQTLQWVEKLFDREPHAATALFRLLLDKDPQARRRIEEGTRPWMRFMVDLIHRGQQSGRVRRELDPEAAVVQVGVLILANFALLDIHGWSVRPPAAWRKDRLVEMVRSIRFILLRDASRPKRSK